MYPAFPYRPRPLFLRFTTGPLFGMKTEFKGVGVLFDTYDNDNARNNPSVFVLEVRTQLTTISLPPGLVSSIYRIGDRSITSTGDSLLSIAPLPMLPSRHEPTGLRSRLQPMVASVRLIFVVLLI